MRRHLKKREYKFVALTVMALEVAAFLIFLFGTLGAILGTFDNSISTTDFILLGFGGVAIAFVLLAFAELLQLVMKVEFNTRPHDRHDELIERELDFLKKEDAKLSKLWAEMKNAQKSSASKKAPAPAAKKKLTRKKR